IGVEGEGEQDQHQEGEREDLVDRHPGPCLEAEVLAGDEKGVADHEATSSTPSPTGAGGRSDPVVAAGAAPAAWPDDRPGSSSRWATPPLIVTTSSASSSERSSSWELMITVAPAAVASRTRVSTRSRPSWSSPAWGSSSSHSSGRRATRHASDVRRRCPAES